MLKNLETRKCRRCPKEFKTNRATRLCLTCQSSQVKGQSKKSSKPTKKKSKSLSKLVKELDAVFSQWIRQKYAKNGLVKCVTCNLVKPIKEMQNGHYVSRVHRATRWDEENCHPQCVGCNMFKEGNKAQYTEYLLDEIGEERLRKLIKRGQEVRKFSGAELQQLIDSYKWKLSILKDE